MMENQKQNIKSGMKFYQSTNAEFLNELFGTHYKQWMKCSYKLTNKIIMWFPSLQGIENYG